MLPYCAREEGQLLQQAAFECARGVVLGVLSLLTLLVALFALGRVLRSRVSSSLSSSRFSSRLSLPVVMLLLAAVQVMLASVKYLVVRDERLQVTAAFVRSLSTTLGCAVWGHVALESIGRPDLIGKLLLPALTVFVFYLFLVFVVNLFENWIPCHHPSWLLLSLSQLLITLLFSVFGIASNRVMSRVAQESARVEMASFQDQGSVLVHLHTITQRKRELWILILINTSSAIVQVALDSWLLSLHLSGESCSLLDTAGDEVIRIFLNIMSFLVPVWGTLYVFYFLNRNSFDNSMDVRFDNGSIMGIEEHQRPKEIALSSFSSSRRVNDEEGEDIYRSLSQPISIQDHSPL